MELDVSFNKPADFIEHLKRIGVYENMVETAQKYSKDGTPGFMDFTCDIEFNGKEELSGLRLKLMPKVERISIEIHRAKSIIDGEYFDQIREMFDVMFVTKSPTSVGQSIILNFKNEDINTLANGRAMPSAE